MILTDRTARDRGASGVEYAALLLVGRVQQTLCGIFQGDCQGGAAAGSGGSAASTTTGGGDGPGNGRGGEIGRVRSSGPLAVVQNIGSWLIPGSPAGDPAHGDGWADGEEARDAWGEGDFADWVDQVNESIEENRGDPEYAGDFFAGLGSDVALDVFQVIYDTNHDGIVDADELETAREELGPLAAMLGTAIRHRTLPTGYLDEIRNGDSAALATLINLGPDAFPPEFMVEVAQRVLDDPTSSADVRESVLHALGDRPHAAQLFLADEANVSRLRNEPWGTVADNPEITAGLFDAALRYDAGNPDSSRPWATRPGRGHQQALANIVELVNAEPGWFDGGDFAEVRGVLATRLGPYLPWMSRVGQRDVGLRPGSTNPPGAPLPTSGDNMIEFLGNLMDDPESRRIINGMVTDYIAEQGVAAQWADRLPHVEAGDVDGFIEAEDRAFETAQLVGGLARVVVDGQNAAHLSEQERIDANLSLYDSITGGLEMTLAEGAGALSPPGASIVASAGTEVVLGAVFDQGREMLEEQMENDVDDAGEAAETIINAIADPQDLDEQLEAQGITDPHHRDVLARGIRTILQGELYPALTNAISGS